MREFPLTGFELGEELIRSRHEIDMLELRFSILAAEFDAIDEYDVQGSVSSIDWIRHNCHMTDNAAGDRVAVGRRVTDFPESVLAMGANRIGFAHLAVMARTANALPKAFDENALLDKACAMSPGKFWHACRHYRHSADPKGYAAEQAEQVEQRRLSMSTWIDGSLLLSGVLDPIGGAAIRTALEPLARKSGAHDDRDRERRLADALVELSMHALDTGLIPQSASQRTHLNVTTSLETLMGLTGAPAAEMEFLLPISSRTVGRLACDCSVTRILLDSDSMVIDVGRAKRVISGPMRRALNARDCHCIWPGCERPATWTSGHHLVHWINGGTTELPNLALLCYRHHWMVHEGNWQLVRTDEGKLMPIPPTITFGPRPRGPD